MNLTTLAASFVLSLGCLTGCAAEAGDESVTTTESAVGEQRTNDDALVREDADAIVLEGAADVAGRGAARGCTSRELTIAQNHADQNHTLPIPGSSNTLEPTVTGCSVSNGYIIYTYTY